MTGYVSHVAIKPSFYDELATAVNLLYQSVKERKIYEYLTNIKNVKQNEKRKDI